jgi:hypothetical protein
VNRVQASLVVDPARVGDWQTLLVDAARGPRWAWQSIEVSGAPPIQFASAP